MALNQLELNSWGSETAYANFLSISWVFLSRTLLGVNGWTLGCEKLPDYGGSCTG